MTYTPMMQQYLAIKEQYKNEFLFFRLGDFYELFFEDAKRAASLLEITLTGKDAGAKERIPMCGVPYHAAAGYIETLVSKGYRVAVCEQVENPKVAKGIVKREVVQVITPGTLFEGKTISSASNHFIGAAILTDPIQLAYLDVATGQAYSTTLSADPRTLFAKAQELNIKELVIQPHDLLLLEELSELYDIHLSVYLNELLTHEENFSNEASLLLVSYLRMTQKRTLTHLQQFDHYEDTAFLSIDSASKRNLELIQSIRSGEQKGTLVWLLDETKTAMGSRKLKQWIHQPLAHKAQIEKRLNRVEALLEEFMTHEEIKEALTSVYDMERLVGKVSFGTLSGKDAAQLRRTLQQVPVIRELLIQSSSEYLSQLGVTLEDPVECRELLERAIAETPPLSLKDGGVIRSGYSDELDELRYLSTNGKDWLAELEQKERQITGAKNLKIGYNRIFGYYIELTKSMVHLADESRYIRKQTLANAERFITEELKEKETLILNAQEQAFVLETQLFEELRLNIQSHIPILQKVADKISELDVLQAFATCANRYQLTRPLFEEGIQMEIREGRHPVVEKMMNNHHYVANDCVLTDSQNMLLITGPNMSGKSTYMRQIAITIIMAQMGSFVPAKLARLPITDKIFTRIGAADDLAGGQSTFMLEMVESRNAIVGATANSLLLFDEIGRGTSTYDGMSLAQAMMEYIHDKIGANTLFSTHYHELTELEGQLARLKNVHVAATEQDRKVVFQHKVKDGAADKSYGIHVAELAELPSVIIQRAQQLLTDYEEQEDRQLSLFDFQQLSTIQEPVIQEPHVVIQQLQQMNVLELTPIEAMNILFALQKQVVEE
ncbi:DNA mismatch repair protein MutS [Chryseomicrobium sp. FSL W7-1435]|uniref:DNA mismatch repair protein MutS n=1 Tax=Chryseomicrobium sp. FSL W7-1435 TaxID=2921704 RepID=UPI00315A1D95